jgi:hypothetical protein
MPETQNAPPAQRTGGCLCGAVRFSIDAPPITVRTCWCRLCQYLGAGSATVNVCFPTAAVHITGAPRTYVSTADSGNEMHRSFCPTCGTPLFSAAAARPHLLYIRVGALDDRENLAPAATIWTSEAPPWACIDPAIPQLRTQPPPAA